MQPKQGEKAIVVVLEFYSNTISIQRLVKDGSRFTFTSICYVIPT